MNNNKKKDYKMNMIPKKGWTKDDLKKTLIYFINLGKPR
jgi:hypothetical protein